jgi:pimeloyl-ACP methyl ester carboxylesterase
VERDLAGYDYAFKRGRVPHHCDQSAAYSRENQARRILGVLDALGIQHAIFVGHSVGARRLRLRSKRPGGWTNWC